MSEEKSGARPDENTGPVRSGSPLYRLLELIAGAIAEQFSGQPPSKKDRISDSKSPSQS